MPDSSTPSDPPHRASRAQGRFGWRGLLRHLPVPAVAWLIVVGLACATVSVSADSTDERRVRAGARVFRSLLAPDVALDRKATAGRLRLLIYSTDARSAAEVGDLIAPAASPDAARIRDLPVDRVTSAILPGDAPPLPAAVFLATRLSSAEIDALVRWSIANHVIVYSPFEGDVERGIPAGLAVEAKVQPFLNLTTLEAAGIELKPFFVQVAKVHR
ncbi:MAG TPA: hypothetical protein VLF18_18420 [Tahibacter sp.]|uniref:hypothetical protein n=1 Tax=Tahibacter sp. TaxID=2056211 RepID=UPI002C4D697B|nr:hypothetical protein [Tahibacter sp.]HSX62163.1 hypothetical protein [Tahibacter sp.]